MPYCPDCGAAAAPADTRCETCGERLRDDVTEDPGERPDRDDGFADGTVSLPTRALAVPAFGVKYALAAGARPPLVLGVLGLVAGVLALVSGAVAAFAVLAMTATYGVLAVPIAILLVPVTLTVGYAVRVTDAAAHGRSRPPAFRDYYQTAVDGLVAALALLPWALATWLLATPALSLAPTLGAAVVVLALVPLPAIWTTYAARGPVAAYHPVRLARTMATATYVLGWLTCLLAVGALALIAAAASVVVLTIPFVWPVVAVVAAAHWGAVGYRLDLADDDDSADERSPDAPAAGTTAPQDDATASEVADS